MQKLDATSEEVLPKSIDFFRTDPVTIAYQQSSTVAYHPQNPLSTTPITFRINTGQSYIDFSKCYLVTSFKISKKGKDDKLFLPITKDDPVSFIQNFGGSFIKSLRVMFNGKQVYNSNELYAYNSYLRRRLGLDVSRNQEYLQLSGYFEDGLDQMSGEGFEARRALYENGATFETVCSIDADIFRQKKLLLNQMVVEIEITPHNNFFALLNTGKDEYKYSIVDCKLYTKQHLLVPQLEGEFHFVMDSSL
uniref:Uncharacterized protein n=1 Tax=Panagrolaimus sp. ES5 TaxID=591445 RepID=A0AC34G888_9BILA